MGKTYRETTFCDGAGGTCLLVGECRLFLSEEVLRAADDWWYHSCEGDGETPIATFADARDLDCYETNDSPDGTTETTTEDY